MVRNVTIDSRSPIKRTRPLFFGTSALTLMLVILFVSQLFALEPPTREQIEKYRRDGTLTERIAAAHAIGNDKADPVLIAHARYTLMRMIKAETDKIFPQGDPLKSPPSAWQGMPTTGTVHIPVLLISFSDYPSRNSADYIHDRLFGDPTDGYPYESLKNYYFRSSYGQLDIEGTVLGWYQTGYPRSNVDQSTFGRQQLIREALQHYDDAGQDFSQFDNDGNGSIDYLVVIWTGPHGEWSSFWWGYQTSFNDVSFTLDGKHLGKYSWQWETYYYDNDQYPQTFSPRTVIHESGHALGLPDYYDYDDTVGPGGGVGGLDMMDGNWGDHNCFSKFLLGWLTPDVYTSGTHSITLKPTGESPEAVVIMPDVSENDLFDEYFMVQNRTRVNNDQNFPNDGLLIWHVDAHLNSVGSDYLFDNSYTAHKLLRLQEADGLEEIEREVDWADAGDYYVPGSTFGIDTVPDNRRYDGLSSGVEVGDITRNGNDMTFSVKFDQRAPRIRHVAVAANPTVAIIRWETDEKSTGVVHYGPGEPVAQTMTDDHFVKGHAVRLEGLTPDSTIYFTLESADLNGNQVDSTLYYFTTPSTGGEQQVAFTDDMESGATGWTESGLSGDSAWSLTETNHARSASHAWFCQDNSEYQDEYLMTPPIDLRNLTSASLSFYHTYSLQNGYTGAQVLISTDDGASFQDLGSLIQDGGYTAYISNRLPSPMASEQAWTSGTIGAMTKVDVDLTPYTGRQVIIAFRMASGSWGNNLGWYVDDVQVQGTAAPAARVQSAVPGDLNRDDVVNSVDLMILAQFVADSQQRIPAGDEVADLNFDGRVNVVDQLLLQGLVNGDF